VPRAANRVRPIWNSIEPAHGGSVVDPPQPASHLSRIKLSAAARRAPPHMSAPWLAGRSEHDPFSTHTGSGMRTRGGCGGVAVLFLSSDRRELVRPSRSSQSSSSCGNSRDGRRGKRHGGDDRGGSEQGREAAGGRGSGTLVGPIEDEGASQSLGI
jgi:hypothetical protein